MSSRGFFQKNERMNLFLLHCKPIPVMKTGFSLCSISNRENPVFINLEPCNENRMFPVWKYYTGKTLFWPCTGPVRDCSVVCDVFSFVFWKNPRLEKKRFDIIWPLGGHNQSLLVEIGLNDLPKSGCAMAHSATPGTIPLGILNHATSNISNFLSKHFY